MTKNVPENVVMVCEKTMATLLLEYMVAQEEISRKAFEKFESVVQQFEKQNAEKSSNKLKSCVNGKLSAEFAANWAIKTKQMFSSSMRHYEETIRFKDPS